MLEHILTHKKLDIYTFLRKTQLLIILLLISFISQRYTTYYLPIRLYNFVRTKDKKNDLETLTITVA